MLSSEVKSYCRIANNTCSVNEEVFFSEASNISEGDFLNTLYKKMEINYPKFFKMDVLCKLGILASEFLLMDLGAETGDETAILLSNNASSLQTDRRHLENISSSESYFPSPSVFVYTLPNIVIGEISIKHKITGEGVFFISEKHNFEDLESYVEILLGNGIVKRVLAGFVEADTGIAEAELRLYGVKI